MAWSASSVAPAAEVAALARPAATASASVARAQADQNHSLPLRVGSPSKSVTARLASVSTLASPPAASPASSFSQASRRRLSARRMRYRGALGCSAASASARATARA